MCKPEHTLHRPLTPVRGVIAANGNWTSSLTFLSGKDGTRAASSLDEGDE
jgi:hypothetical protein